MSGPNIFAKITHAEECELGCRIVPHGNMNEVQLTPACRAKLIRDAESDADEAAYERSLEAFYGGSEPVTLQEQYEAADRRKRAGG